ncbi:thioredoxin-dependent thiol peroxidase [Flavobacterium silvaticum]|uniref:thioredoxin-dependent peroxiredoxin n=1 Tax=Flavobacterium silvaticum TaxID=1852020 RepID=A0A972FJH1_9FLAO|nr:thioredoxin-dependent thiol peroxidase [Flavobacterium silvaticum]NMH26807.1 thioredoxin-dependent thiol peroxidase [Flavobacterium silvaticum]
MKMLKPGDKVPDFSALDQDEKKRSLSDYKGKKLIVFFYPAASTPTCTVEACNLRDNYALLKKKGYALLGVSADTVKKQSNFAKKHELKFPLLSDVDHKIIDAFGVWGPKKFMGLSFDGIYRTTFVIDENGIVERVIDKVKSKDHAAQLLEG